MKSFHRVVLAVGLVLSAGWAQGQGTSFSHQGFLTQGGVPASGVYDLQFTPYDAASGGAVVSPSNVVTALAVTGGLFNVTLDFGSGIFEGSARWLEMAVRTNGAASFETISPRQPLLPAPYAIHARGVAATGIVGAISGGQIAAGAVSNSHLAVSVQNDLASRASSNVVWSTFATAAGLSAEMAARSGADAALSNSVSSLTTNVAARADSNLVWSTFATTAALTAEQSARIGADAALSNRVASLDTNVAARLASNVWAAANATTNHTRRTGDAMSGALTNLVGFVGNGTGLTNVYSVRGIQLDADGDAFTLNPGANSVDATVNFSSILGGDGNTIGTNANFSVIPGGRNNAVADNVVRSFASGFRAKVYHSGTFIWADNTTADFGSSAVNQFLIRASGGVGIGKTNPVSALDVAGTVTASGFAGNGAGLTNLSGAAIADGSISNTDLSASVLTNIAARLDSNVWAAADSTTNYVRRTGDSMSGVLSNVAGFAGTFTGSLVGNGAGISNIPLGSLGAQGSISAGDFVSNATLSVGSGPWSVLTADVNGDGHNDLVSANSGSATLSIRLNDGKGSCVLSSSPGVGTFPEAVAAADVNGDGRVDLICANNTANTLMVLTNRGSGLFSSNATYGVGSGPNSVRAVDVNGDGRPDLICANQTANTLSVLTNNGSGAFTLSSSPGTGLRPYSVLVEDVNGDGIVDLISANQNADTLSVLTNNGTGGFTLSSSPVVGDGPYSVAAADVNGDGKLDLISANNSASTVSVLTNNGSGTFYSNATYSVGLHPFSIAAADVTGDDAADVITANIDANTLSVLVNNGSGGFTPLTTIPVGSQPRSVAAADINGDGLVDLVSANTGANSLSVLFNTPTFSGSFNGDGSGITGITTASLAASFATNIALLNTSTQTFAGIVQASAFAGAFSGNGAGLTNLSGGAIAGGTISNVSLATEVLTNIAARLASNVWAAANATTNYTRRSGDTMSGILTNRAGFTGNGSGLTNIGAASLSTSFSTNIALLNGSQTFSGPVNFISASSSFRGSFSGTGSSLSNLNVNTLIEGIGGPYLLTWGYSFFGLPDVPASATGVVGIACGFFFNIALRSDGRVVPWGDNGHGQLDVPSIATGVVAITCGYDHCLALRADGTVIAWGENGNGQTNVPASATGVVAVAGGGYYSLALRSNGTVIAWGDNSDGQTNVPASATGVVAIAGGAYHGLALRSNGTIIAWGSNSDGQTNVPASATGVVAIAAGGYHNLALRADGTVVAWGNNWYGQANVPASATGVVAIAAGGYHNLALRGDGTVVAWGLNSFGQTNVPASATGVVAIAAGYEHSLALRAERVPAQVALLNRNNTFAGTVQAVAFEGNGAGLTNISGSALNAGSVSNTQLAVSVLTNISARLASNVWAAANATTNYTRRTGDAMTGSLSLPQNGLAVGTTQLVVSAGNVGIGTAVPDARLSVIAPGVSSGNNSAMFSVPAIGPHQSHIHYGTNGDWYIRSASSAGAVIIQDTGGNVGIGTTTPTNKLHVVGTVQATAYITGSDAGSKENIIPVSVEEILAKVAGLPMATWTFKDDPRSGRHLGPMAQDFRAAFGLGNTDSGIFTVDADGVALAAIQGLHAEVRGQKSEVSKELIELKKQNEELQRQLDELRALIQQLSTQGK